MTDKDWQYVAEIARCGSITKAAEHLFISQPSLTQALRRIEEYYGAEFFSRARDGVQLTDMGRAYLAAADRIGSLYQRLQEEIGSAAGLSEARLNIGITAVQSSLLLPRFLTLWQKSYPGLELRIVEETSGQLERLTFEGRLNIAVIHTPFHDYKLAYTPLYEESFCLAVPPDDPDYLAASGEEKRPLLTRDILSRQRFNLLSAHQRCRQMADRILSAAGVAPKLHYITSNMMTALSLTQAGQGATFVPESFLQHFSSLYRLGSFRIPAEWGASWQMVAAYASGAVLTPREMTVIRLLQDCAAEMRNTR